VTIWADEPFSNAGTLLAAWLGDRVRVDKVNALPQARVADERPNVVDKVMLVDLVAHLGDSCWKGEPSLMNLADLLEKIQELVVPWLLVVLSVSAEMPNDKKSTMILYYKYLQESVSNLC
jgi:hypothetical protein